MGSKALEADSLSLSDSAMLKAVKDSLSLTLEKDQCNPKEISLATESMSTLRNRMVEIRGELITIAAEEGQYSNTESELHARQKQMDMDIIDCKMKAGELLSERDAIARDLGRAKRELEMQDKLVDTVTSSSTDAGHGAPTDSEKTHTNTQMDQHLDDEGAKEEILRSGNPESLEISLQDDMSRLSAAEKELVEVLEEINTMKTRKAELQEKLKAAQEEW